MRLLDSDGVIKANNPYGADAPDSFTYGFYGASGNGTPQGGNGANVVGIQQQTIGQCYLYQALAEPLNAGTYKLTVAVGALTNLTPLDSYVISIGTMVLLATWSCSTTRLRRFADSGSRTPYRRVCNRECGG